MRISSLWSGHSAQVHDTVKQGLVSYLIAIAREKGLFAYIGDGNDRWAAAHVSDGARLYRLALEKAEPGERYHAVADHQWLMGSPSTPGLLPPGCLTTARPARSAG
jgi:nucleoside-diphosphate-sugar epimerase